VAVAVELREAARKPISGLGPEQAWAVVMAAVERVLHLKVALVLLRDELCRNLAPRRIHEPDARIPLRVLGEPRLGVRSHALRHEVRQKVPRARVARHESLVHHDVGIEDLPGLRMHARGADRVAHIAVGPEHEVVARILRVLVHVRTGSRILLVHLDRAVDADLLERLVPREDAVAHVAAVADRHRVLDVEDDRLLRRAQLQRRIGLLDLPSVDVAHEGILLCGLAHVLVGRGEVADPLIREARLVARVLGDLGDRVGDRGEPPACDRHLVAELHIARESLGLGHFHQAWVHAADASAEERRRAPAEDVGEVDHVAAARTDADDRCLEEHPVSEHSVATALALLVARGAHGKVGLNERQLLSEALEGSVLVAELHACLVDAARDGVGEEEEPLLDVLGKFREQVGRGLVAPKAEETADAIQV